LKKALAALKGTHIIGAIDCSYVFCLPMSERLVLSDHNLCVPTSISANISSRHASFNEKARCRISLLYEIYIGFLCFRIMLCSDWLITVR
jgi:hypothetical protein